jgi:transketolase
MIYYEHHNIFGMSTPSPSMTQLARLVRYYSLVSTTAAGSGHPSSCLSAADIMTTLLFGGYFQADLDDPAYPNNDRLIFSKGHAAPLLYALYAAAGVVTESELCTLRQFDSRLEGHPTLRFPYAEACTGSLGQGLSIGVGMALSAKHLEARAYRTYVLLGDSEMAEGQVWEAMAIAAEYKLDNLIAVLDVNRLGQRGETMSGHDVRAYQQKAAAFGWHTIGIDGHSIAACKKAYAKALKVKGKPTLIIAKTYKGKGVSFVQNKSGWHGRALTEEELDRALLGLGRVNPLWRGTIARPRTQSKHTTKTLIAAVHPRPSYTKGDMIAVREAYGQALSTIAFDTRVVVLDAETSNSTRAEVCKEVAPDRFFELYIAEQNMVSTALGLSRRGAKPFVSSFAAFLTRAFDQLRMAQYSDPNMVICGSHAGVSIGEDGASQMALEDIGMMRSIQGSVVLYPSDAWSMQRAVELAHARNGLTYIRSTRAKLPVLYTEKTAFKIGGSRTLVQSKKDAITIITAGITVHEALAAATQLKAEGIFVRVVDMYSVKPLDTKAIAKACAETQALIVVEDHYREGGLYEAICASGVVAKPTYSLAVTKMPRSGTPAELLAYMGIDADGIVRSVREIL